MGVTETAEHNLLTDLTVGQLLAVMGTVVVLIGLVRTINPLVKRLNNLMDDWFGQPPRAGVPQRKGVMERLSDQDAAIAVMQKKVEPVVNINTTGNHAEVLEKLNDIQKVAKVNTSHLTKVEKLLHRHIRESQAWLDAVEKKTKEVDWEMPPWPYLPDPNDDDEDG